MKKQVFPGAEGSPLAKGIAVGNLLFLSGQVAGAEAGESIEEQTLATLNLIATALEDCGSSVKQVVKTTVYMTDMSGKSEMNRVYADFFGRDLPARTTVGVNDLGPGVLIEIDVIAELG